MLSVGGWYDAEDPMGPFSTFYETSRRNPENAEVTLCAGPWAHGQWSSGEGPTTMGNVEFFAKTEEYYREHIVSRRHPSATASACSRLLYVILRIPTTDSRSVVPLRILATARALPTGAALPAAASGHAERGVAAAAAAPEGHRVRGRHQRLEALRRVAAGRRDAEVAVPAVSAATVLIAL